MRYDYQFPVHCIIEVRGKMLGEDCNTMSNGTSQGIFGGELFNEDDSEPGSLHHHPL